MDQPDSISSNALQIHGRCYPTLRFSLRSIMITRINRIKNHRVFKDFSWHEGLHDFGRFNLIYGWNGSGKTTLSNLLRNIERKAPIMEGQVEFQVDGKQLSGAALTATVDLPKVRVFNRDYVNAVVFSTQSTLSPIFFFGEHSVEKQKKIEELKLRLTAEVEKGARRQREKTRAIDDLDKFCIQQAKVVKAVLSSSGSNPFNFYDKANFRQSCKPQAAIYGPPKIHTAEEKLHLKQQKDALLRDRVVECSFVVPDLTNLKDVAACLLNTSVVSRVLDELVADVDLARWVQEGLAFHNPGLIGTCQFCAQSLPVHRLDELKAHFNDEYTSFLAEVDTFLDNIAAQINEIRSITLPNKAQVYQHLSIAYSNAEKALASALEDIATHLEALHRAVVEKRTKPFEAMTLDSSLEENQGTYVEVTSGLSALNDVIAQHNSQSDHFTSAVVAARSKLEQALVAEAVDDFRVKTSAIRLADEGYKSISSSIADTREQIAVHEKEIVEHRRPADELNSELCSYLGRAELKFDTKDTGYVITRNGMPASNFSEGERTAIAFLYFLKSLSDKTFSISQDIVVIDDPVSSLDSNSLFCAFGYMQDRTKDAGQLFILTHNFAFFRQIKNWFNHLPHQGSKAIDKRPARFFMLDGDRDVRTNGPALVALDPLLHEFESEYHFLFKKIMTCISAGAGDPGLEHYYFLPNIARRVLEAFLSFRFPSDAGNLKRQLDQVGFDSGKKSRILRFLHTYSHDGKIAEPEHDLSILSETPQILKDLLDLMKAEDERHFDQMIALTGLSPTTTQETNSHNVLS